MSTRDRWVHREEPPSEDRNTVIEAEDTQSLPDLGTPVGVSLTVLHGTGLRHLFYLGHPGGTIGRGDGADVRLVDPSVSRWHARIELQADGFAICDLDSANGTFIDGERIEGSALLPCSCRLALGPHTVLHCMLVDETGAESVRQLEQPVFYDTLTGTGNRRFFAQRLREELSYSMRHQQPLGLLFVDLDHFKKVNDQFGHPVGDQMLAEVGRTLKETVREEDSVYRYGGEEFVVLARGARRTGLFRLGERMRLAIESLAMPVKDESVCATASVGAAFLGPDEMLDMMTWGGDVDDEEDSVRGNILIEHADEALYQAKNSGRNRVVVYSGFHEDA